MSKFYLIDREALGIGKAKREAFENPAYADGWNSAIEIVNNAPTVDAVPVVRCKDCRMYCPKLFVVSSYCTICGEEKSDDDFCSRGERKEGNAAD